MSTIYIVSTIQGKPVLAFASEERAAGASRLFQGGLVTPVHYEPSTTHKAPTPYPGSPPTFTPQGDQFNLAGTM